MSRYSRRGFTPRPRMPRTGLSLLNLGFVILLLVGVLLYKQIVADQAAGFMDQFAPPEGTGDSAVSQGELTVDVCRSLVHRAADRAAD